MVRMPTIDPVQEIFEEGLIAMLNQTPTGGEFMKGHQKEVLFDPIDPREKSL